MWSNSHRSGCPGSEPPDPRLRGRQPRSPPSAVPLAVTLDRLHHFPHRRVALLPSHCDHALPLEILVDLEEVLDLPVRMLRQIGDVEELVLKGIVRRHRDDLSVRVAAVEHLEQADRAHVDRKSTRLNSSHANISYAVFCLKKKKKTTIP